MEIVKRVYQALITIEGRNELITADCVIYQGSLWAVPEWIEAADGGRKRPRRMIRLPTAAPSKGMPHDFVEPWTLPATLFDLEQSPPPHPQLRTIEDPDLWVQMRQTN